MATSENILRVPVADLHFDPLNPRLPRSLVNTDDQAVLDWMLEDAGLLELMGSIAVKGFFPAEPLLIMPAEDGTGFWVLEGNRRLAAVSLLNEPNRAPRRKKAVADLASLAASSQQILELPCVLFDRRDDVLDYLGYRHITGIKQWEPAAKARYLRSLFDEHQVEHGSGVYRYIARIIGSRADYVMRLLGALQLYERALSDRSIEILEESASFSILTLALNYRSIVEFLELPTLEYESFLTVNAENLRRLATWLYIENASTQRTALGDSRNMRYLATAVANADGLEALDRGETAEEAAAATVDAHDILNRALRTARDRLGTAQSLIHKADISPEVLRLLEEVQNLVDQLQFLTARKVQRAGRGDV